MTDYAGRPERPGSWFDWHTGCGWWPVTDPYMDAPDGAEMEWPEFGPGVWRRSGDRWCAAGGAR